MTHPEDTESLSELLGSSATKRATLREAVENARLRMNRLATDRNATEIEIAEARACFSNARVAYLKAGGA